MIKVLSEAATPIAAPTAPCARLNRPVPAVEVGDHDHGQNADDRAGNAGQQLRDDKECIAVAESQQRGADRLGGKAKQQ